MSAFVGTPSASSKEEARLHLRSHFMGRSSTHSALVDAVLTFELASVMQVVLVEVVMLLLVHVAAILVPIICGPLTERRCDEPWSSESSTQSDSSPSVRLTSEAPASAI